MSTVPAAAPDTTEATAKPEPSGLGGWLILVGFGVVISPFVFLAAYPHFTEVFKPETWYQLTSPNSPHYHPMISTLLIGEAIGNISLLLFSCYLIFLFFTKSPRFPKSWIGFLWLNAVFLTADLYLLSIIPAVASEAGGALLDVVRSYAGAIVWTAYMLMSVRVRNTFVKQNDFY